MNIDADEFSSRSRLKALLHHFAEINDPREAWRVMYPLPEILLLAVCGTVCDCDGYEHIAAWGETHVDFLRRYLPYERGTPCGRWLTVFMNRINPGLFQQAFTAFVREAWPDKPALAAIDGKTSRRSHGRSEGEAPLHLVSAFASPQKTGAREPSDDGQIERDQCHPHPPRTVGREGRPQGSHRHHRRQGR